MFNPTDMNLKKTKALLSLLSANLTTSTKFIKVPNGTKTWKARTLIFFVTKGARKSAEVQLEPFFGLYVGYDPDLDILVYWEPQSPLLKGNE